MHFIHHQLKCKKVCCPSISPVQNSPTSVGCCSQSLLSTRQCLPFCPSPPSTPDCLPQAKSDQVLCRLSRLSLVGLHRLCVLVFWNRQMKINTKYIYWLSWWQCHLFECENRSASPYNLLVTRAVECRVNNGSADYCNLGGLHLQREGGLRVDAFSPPPPGRTLAPSCF